jgi:hypothetical protein
MPTPGLVGAVWRTSSRGDAKRACVEVAVGPGEVGVRTRRTALVPR